MNKEVKNIYEDEVPFKKSDLELKLHASHEIQKILNKYSMDLVILETDGEKQISLVTV